MRIASLLAAASALATMAPSTATANQYARVAVVAEAPTGDYATPTAAMAALADWCGTPSAASPCLIKVMPGVYDLQGARLVLVPYLDIEGSGANGTTIKGQVKAGLSARNVELRSLSIENSGATTDSAAFYCGGDVQSASIKLTDVTITGIGTPGVFFDSTCVVALDRATVKASGTSGDVIGIFFNNGDEVGALTVNDSSVSATGGTASYGVYLRGHGGSGMFTSPIRIRSSSIAASGASGVDTGVLNIANAKVEFSDLDVSSGDVGIMNVPGPAFVSGYVYLSGSRVFAPTTISNQGGLSIVMATRLVGAGGAGLSGNGFRCMAVTDGRTLNPAVCPP
jgi:hypothetical protein